MSQRTLICVVAAAVLLLLNGMIVAKEHQLASGESLYFELAPVDPRSLMQGDYMRLNYDVAQRAEQSANHKTRRGHVIVTVDERGVARFARNGGSPLAPAERLVRWKRKDRGVVVGADAFYFQEGQREHFQAAKFAELKVGDDGKTLLVGLLDRELNPL